MSEKTERNHKKLDPDIRALGQAMKALASTSKRMRRYTLEFLWDKYVTHGWKEPEPAR